MRIVLVRHGQTEWSRSGKHTSTTDLPLTDEGREAARALAPLLRARTFALVLSSPRLRARETCRLAGLEGELDEDLVEFDYGEYEGITTAEIHERRPDWDLWTDGCPAGETPDDVGARMDALIAERLRDGPERILAARWLGLDAREGRALLLRPAGLGVTGAEHGRPAVDRWGI